MKFLEEFNVIIEQKVAWGDMDALGHVNNAVYFKYFESARIEYFTHVNLLDPAHIQKIGPVLKDTYCRYRRPVTFPDTLSIGIKVTQLKKYEFVMEYKAVSNQHQHLTTQGQATIVLFDFEKGRKIEVPDFLVEAITAIEGDLSQMSMKINL